MTVALDSPLHPNKLRSRARKLGMTSWTYGMYDNPAGQKEMLDWADHHGLRFSSTDRCLRWLRRGRCNDHLCVETREQYAWMDHVTAWTQARHPAVIVAQPYALDAHALDQLADLRDDGLRVEIDGTGWYGRGTTFVAVWAADLGPAS